MTGRDGVPTNRTLTGRAAATPNATRWFASGRRVLIFGMGYSAQFLGARLLKDGWSVAGTSRQVETCLRLSEAGYAMHRFDAAEADAGSSPLHDFASRATHILISTPPDDDGDVSWRRFGDVLGSDVEWAGYLSTTGVYGDHGGDWVDETTPLRPHDARAHRRCLAERQWLDWGAHQAKRRGFDPVHIFRLPGIYGPGRNAPAALISGRARRIVKADHVFCRIHVADLAKVLAASMKRPDPRGRIYNVCDDEPASSSDVMLEAARLLRVAAPPPTRFEDIDDASPMLKAFYSACKRVSNARLKKELGVTLDYPTYREGLRALPEVEGRGKKGE